ncbi:MAG: hypothetical protein JNM36_04335 [Chitinophagales bacterium]|nr:hypothetical protein [Chitinophagales bacterium]HNI45254.1 hypothetical protein [Chitinophagales bacterium]HNL07483.1 hypothetical protein [Chitinophagales bacterium]
MLLIPKFSLKHIIAICCAATLSACQSNNTLPLTPDSEKTVAATANTTTNSNTPNTTSQTTSTTNTNQANTSPQANMPKHIRKDFRFVDNLSQKGVMNAGDVHEYTFKGRGGQKTEVKLTATSKDLYFHLLRPDEQHLASKQHEWKGTLPANGNYIVRIEMPQNAQPTKSSYRININPENLKDKTPSREELLQKGGFKQ